MLQNDASNYYQQTAPDSTFRLKRPKINEKEVWVGPFKSKNFSSKQSSRRRNVYFDQFSFAAATTATK